MFFRLLSIPASLLLLPGCVLCPIRAHHSATGVITGCVLDINSRPAANANVIAVYERGWTWVGVPNALIVAETHTDAEGRFRLVTRKRVDALSAHTIRPCANGHLNDVDAGNNVIHFAP